MDYAASCIGTAYFVALVEEGVHNLGECLYIRTERGLGPGWVHQRVFVDRICAGYMCTCILDKHHEANVKYENSLR